ncbi:MAG: transketolase family protein [Chloroflexi bacterium]|nr:transketolase family protein [Chloroflexota bacterium]
MKLGKATRDAFGEALKELGAENPDIVVVDGDVANSTRTEYFAADFPERFFSVGIAESNLVGVASGLAAAGKIPVAASFACFIMGNGFEQLRMSVAFPNLNVKLVGSHSGISIGEDGPSQMAIEDLALACSLPNMTVLVPADEPATKAATRAMLQYRGPVYLRTGRPKAPLIYEAGAPFQIGKANLLREGKDVTIIACGLMVAQALAAADSLAKEGIATRVLDMHTLKPIDRQAVIKAARETGAIVTCEEHTIYGGLGSIVSRVLAENQPAPLRAVAIQDTYAESGKPEELFAKYGLTAPHIVAAAKEAIAAKKA